MERYRKTAGILLALFVALILYGSFYPFRFDLEYAKVRFSAPLDYWLVSDVPSSRVDFLFNILAYTPIGLLLALIVPNRWGFWRGLLVSTMAGGLLSLTAELGQNAFRSRYPMLIDLETNTVGSALGFAAAGWLLRRNSRWLGLALEGLTRVPFAAWALLLLWGALHAAPFVPSGFFKLRLALRHLAEWNWNVAGIAKWLAAWVLLIAALRRVMAPRFFLLVFAVLAPVSMSMRLLIRGQALGPDEILALGLALPFLVPTVSRLLGIWTVLLCLVVSGLAPFEFRPTKNVFGWLPFAGVLEPDPDRVFLVLLEKTYLYLGAVWMAVESGLAAVPAGVAVAALLGLVEAAQLWVPGRTPEITDSLMALLAILVVREHAPSAGELRGKLAVAVRGDPGVLDADNHRSLQQRDRQDEL